MKVVIAAGGTAGHVNPALAVAQEIMKQEPDSQIVFFGRPDGMEKELVEKSGYMFEPLDVHGFKRSLQIKKIAYNIRSVVLLGLSFFQLRRKLKQIRPDVVLGFGGYVSGPVVYVAHQLGIPTAIQEQNSFPGLTTKLLKERVNLIFSPNSDASEALQEPDRTVLTGNPVREDLLHVDRQEARKRLGIQDHQVCVLSFGGSLGSSTINKLAANTISLANGDPNLFFIHATGEIDQVNFHKVLEEKGTDLTKQPNRVSMYINDMADCLAASDLVVCRSGAITITELAAVGRASYLIPSPFVAENHQYYNAMTLGKIGAAVVREEKDLVMEQAAEEILQLAKQPDKLATMGEKARSCYVPDAAQRIYREIQSKLL